MGNTGRQPELASLKKREVPRKAGAIARALTGRDRIDPHRPVHLDSGARTRSRSRTCSASSSADPFLLSGRRPWKGGAKGAGSSLNHELGNGAGPTAGRTRDGGLPPGAAAGKEGSATWPRPEGRRARAPGTLLIPQTEAADEALICKPPWTAWPRNATRSISMVVDGRTGPGCAGDRARSRVEGRRSGRRRDLPGRDEDDLRPGEPAPGRRRWGSPGIFWRPLRRLAIPGGIARWWSRRGGGEGGVWWDREDQNIQSGVRPWRRTNSGCCFDHLPGVVVLELGGAQIAEG